MHYWSARPIAYLPRFAIRGSRFGEEQSYAEVALRLGRNVTPARSTAWAARRFASSWRIDCTRHELLKAGKRRDRGIDGL